MKRITSILFGLLFVLFMVVALPTTSNANTVSNGVQDEYLSVNRAKIKQIEADNEKLTVKIYSVAGASGYQVQISTAKKFRSKYTRTVTVNGNLSKNRKVALTKVKNKSKLVKLQNGKKYYIRVRAFKTIQNGDTTIKSYGKWSVVKTKKPKKYKKKVTVYYY